MKNLVASLVFASVLSGCVSSAEIGTAENKSNRNSTDIKQEKHRPALSASTTNMRRLSRYGAVLSDEFLKLADRSHTSRDISTVVLIAYAADAASEALGDASAANLGRRAIVGTAFSETNSFLNPATATGGLLLASRRSQCLSNVAAVGKESAPNRVEIIGAYLRTQFEVRNSLRGVAPDYATLTANFAKAVEGDPSGAKSLIVDDKIDDVSKAVASCMLTGQ